MSRLLGVRITISGDLKLSSLNERGLGEVLKREEISNWLRKKNSQFTCSKGHIARKTTFTYGQVIGNIKVSLVLLEATKQVHAYSLRIILIYKSIKHAQTIAFASLFVT